MNSTVATESGITFDFHSNFIKADLKPCYGVKSVDFVIDSDKLYLIEVKNYDNPKATAERKNQDLLKLSTCDKTFLLEIGMKLKDTLLKRYAEGQKISKPVKFLLLLKCEALGAKDWVRLVEAIRGYVPSGLTGFPDFQYSITFDVPKFNSLKEKYGLEIISE